MPYNDYDLDKLYQKGWAKQSKNIDSSELLEACKLAYRKHHLNDDSIGWTELSNKLLNALCNAMTSEGFEIWLISITNNL